MKSHRSGVRVHGCVIAPNEGPHMLKPIRVGRKSGKRLAITIGRKALQLHKLVALAFLGPRPEGYEIDHVNGDPLDNAASNLEYVTHEENVRRATANGSMRRSPRRYSEDVRAIILSSTLSSRKLSAQIGMSAPNIVSIRRQNKDQQKTLVTA